MRFPVPADNAFGRPAQLEFGQDLVDVFLIDRPSTGAVFPLGIVVSLSQKDIIQLTAFQLRVDGALTSFQPRCDVGQ